MLLLAHEEVVRHGPAAWLGRGRLGKVLISVSFAAHRGDGEEAAEMEGRVAYESFFGSAFFTPVDGGGNLVTGLDPLSYPPRFSSCSTRLCGTGGMCLSLSPGITHLSGGHSSITQ